MPDDTDADANPAGGGRPQNLYPSDVFDCGDAAAMEALRTRTQTMALDHETV